MKPAPGRHRAALQFAMEQPIQAQALVDRLLTARLEQQPLPAPGVLGLAEAYEIQRLHQSHILSRFGGEIAGIKLGGTNSQSLATLGLNSPFRGPIFSAFTSKTPAVMKRADFMVCIVEAEIGVCFGQDLESSSMPPTRDALLAAIDTVFPAIEIADSRYVSWATAPAAAIVADLGYAGGWVRGAPCAHWRDIDVVSLPVRLSLDGVEVRSGSGAFVLGDPLHALALAVADLGRQGRAIRAGDVVSTGTCTAPLVVPGSASLVADFGPMGQVVLELA